MRTAGIIAEYNPFHNGHAWQIAELKKRGFEAVVCVCSPGVVQRGTAALFPAQVRTRAALAAGADLVLSLPAPYATLSAEGFAAAGVALLSALGCVDALCFGTETRRLEDIAQTAALLESPDFPAALRGQLDAGLPLPAARAAAAEALCPGAAALAPHVPPACLRLYMQAEAEGDILDGRAFGIAVLSRLRAMDAAGLRAVRGAAEGLENRLAAAVQGAGTLDELVQAMRTKRYATARLRRLVLDAALGYTGDLPALPPYLHVLGANETGLAVLRCARQAALLPLSHSLADLAARSAPAARVAAAHAAAEDLTALCLRHPAPMGAAYTAKPVFPTSGAK